MDNNCQEGFHVSDQINVALAGWNFGLVRNAFGDVLCGPFLYLNGACSGSIAFTGDLGNTAVDPNFASAFSPGGSLRPGQCILQDFNFFVNRFFVTGYAKPGIHTFTATLFACQFDPNDPFAPPRPTNQIVATTTLSITVLPDKPQQQFALSLGQDGSGNTLVHQFDANTHSIAQSFIVKLGQQFPVEIAPLNQDGTTGSPLVVTEEIDGAQPGDTLAGSSIPGAVVALFKDKVLLHFASSHSETHHEFFPIHSGTANLKLTFSFNGTSQSLTFPVKVTVCVANGDCDPHLGSASFQFDNLLMAFADRGGIPPQLIKAQVAQESAFNVNAFRYEPLSFDFMAYNRTGKVTVARALQPWLLAQSPNCSIDPTVQGNIPASTNIDLSGPDVTPRQRIYGVFTDNNGNPLCRVPKIPESPVAAAISSSDAVLSMENILYANDACFFHSICSGWATINDRSFAIFADFQVNHPPFTGQTVIASSYGLHQLMYDTAVFMGYTGDDKLGLPPHLLFDPFISLDLGSRFLALKYRTNHGSVDADFPDLSHFLFQYGPALREFNGGRLGFGEIFAMCGNTPYVPAPPLASQKRRSFDYPCLILQRVPRFTPEALSFSSGGN